MVIVGCFFVLRPFLTALAWAVILCTTTWPLFKRVTTALHGRAGFAALTMVLLLLLVMFAPFVIVGATIAENADKMAAWGRAALAAGPPGPPAWLAGLPLIGETLSGHWADVAHDTAQFLQLLSNYLEPLRKFAIASGTSVVGGILQLGLSIFIAWFMFRDGDAIVERLRGATRRIAGERGARLADVAGTTVRGVVLGILGTALAQGVVAGIGFWIVGIAAAPLLGLLTFVLSPVPIGPPLVWVPAALWLIHNGRDRVGHLPARVGNAGRLDDRQRDQAADHQPRRGSAVHPRPARRSGRRDRLRRDRRVPGSRPARGRLCAARSSGPGRSPATDQLRPATIPRAAPPRPPCDRARDRRGKVRAR